MGELDAFLRNKSYSRRESLRIFGGIGAAVAIAGGLAACAPTSGGGNTSNTIRYWTWLTSGESDDPRTLAQQKILDAFRAKYPKLTVVEEVIPWNELQPRLLRAAAAGQAPDVSLQLDQYIQPLAKAGSIVPIDQFADDWSADIKADFLYPWEDGAVAGEKYALRNSIRVANLNFYRPSLLAAAGIQAPSELFTTSGSVPPREFGAFTDFSKTLTRDQTIGFLMPFSKSDNLNRFMQTCPPLFWALGSDLVDAKTGAPTFHEAAGQQIFQWFQDMVYQDNIAPVGEVTMDSEIAATMFQAGTLAQTWHHTGQWAEWYGSLNGDLATATMPSPSGDPVPASTEGGWTHVMSKGANQEAAWQFMEFMVSEEAEVIAGTVAGQLPTRRSTLDADPFFSSDDFSLQAQWLNYLGENSHPATSINIDKRREFADILADAAQLIIAEQADVKSTLSSAADQYATLIGA
ncbi:MAG: hypothetical protein JWP85_1556 [Rhodoglobus sp.]|nr:hypothetical protein [Rhodoglobus sp.]